MTPQEIFNTVWDHFVVNQAPYSVSAAGRCAYRGENGAKCAVGLFIPDDLYDPAMESLTVTMLALHVRCGGEPRGIELQAFLGEHGALLQHLQYAHDCSVALVRHGHAEDYARTELRRRLCDAASYFGLEVPA